MRRAALIGFVIVATLAGCGGTRPSALVIVSAARSKTEAAKTARIRFAFSLQGQTIESEGLADLANNQATYTTKIPGLGTISAIQTGTVLYEKVPTQVAPRSKPWIKFDFTVGLSKLTGVDRSMFSQSASSNPRSALDYLKGVSRDTRKIGSDTLRGSDTAHYRGTIDLTLAAANAKDPTAKSGLQQVAKVLGVSTFPVDVWIDTEGRLRQMKYSLDTSKFAPPDSAVPKSTGTATYTFEFFDFGVVFSKPTLPSVDQVVDVTKEISDPTGSLAATPASSGRPLADAVAPALAGFAESSSPVVRNGPIDPSTFAALLGLDASDGRLHHFTAGYHETFDSSTDFDTYDVDLLQFDSAAAAAQFDEAVVTSLEKDGVLAIADAKLPAGWDWNSKKADSNGAYEHLVIARRQSRVMIIDDTNVRSGATQPLVARLAQEQYERL